MRSLAYLVVQASKGVGRVMVTELLVVLGQYGQE
jgi:hypothetical protein